MPFESLKHIPEKQKEYASSPKFSTLQYRYETLIEKIESGNMNSDMLRKDILNNYRDYCNYDNFHEHRKAFQALWTNKKFLDAFYHSLESLQSIIVNNSYYRTGICKIVYDYYYEIGRNNPDDEVTKLLLKIANTINKREILVLSAFMHDYAAGFIMMANYSSFKQKINIRRVNKFIIKLGYDFSVKNIIDIYAQLYLNNFSTLFNSTLTDNLKDTGLDEYQLAIFNKQNTALLTILESMPEYEIRNVISGFNDFLRYEGNPATRFDVYSISKKDFPRVKKVLSE